VMLSNHQRSRPLSPPFDHSPPAASVWSTIVQVLRGQVETLTWSH
jgi:hypothetical protein